MALPTRVNHLTQETSGSATVTISSAGIDVGNWMICTGHVGITSVTVAPPSGWTELYYVPTMGSRRLYVWARIKESGDTTFDFVKSGSAFVSFDLFWGAGADPVADWQLGTGKLRNTIAENDNTNIAPSITTTEPDVLVLALSAEATSTDNPAPTVSGATEWYTNLDDTGTNIESLTVAYIDKATAGATGDVTFTYTTTQANNGWAVQIGITPAAEVEPDPEPEPALQINGTPVSAMFYNGQSITDAYWGGALLHHFGDNFTVDQLLADSPFFVAHRGLGQSYPEQSMAGYDAAVEAGFKALEVSLHVTSDGVFVASHDPDPSRVFGQSSTPFSSRTWASVQGFTSATGPILRLEDILDKYASSHVIFVDDKTNAHTTELLAIVNGYANPTNHFVWKGFRGWSPAANTWTAAGFETWGIYYDNEVVTGPNFSNFSLLGLNYDATQAQWDIATGTGKPVIAHVVGNDANRIEGAGKGATGFMVTNITALP